MKKSTRMKKRIDELYKTWDIHLSALIHLSTIMQADVKKGVEIDVFSKRRWDNIFKELNYMTLEIWGLKENLVPTQLKEGDHKPGWLRDRSIIQRQIVIENVLGIKFPLYH